MELTEYVFDFIRNLWIAAQLRLPQSVQYKVLPRLYALKEKLRLLIKPRLPVYQLRGEGKGGELIVTYSGMEFTRLSLEDILFTDGSMEKITERLPFWNYDAITKCSSSDIIIFESSKHLIDKVRSRTAIRLPLFVHHLLDVRGSWEDVEDRFHHTVHKNDLRKIRKYEYDYDVTGDTQAFREFYHQMYLPTMQARHGSLASPMSFGEARQYFQHGRLFQIKREGVWVAGGIAHSQSQHDILILDIVGVRNGDSQLIREGAMSARYYVAVHWANQLGYRAVNFRGSDPWLSSGLFQYKRKWGAAVKVPAELQRRIWVKVCRNTPAVAQFFKDNPFVVIGEDEKLHGMIFVDNMADISKKTKNDWLKHYATPGLDSLIVRPITSLIEGAKDADDKMVIPIASDHDKL